MNFIKHALFIAAFVAAPLFATAAADDKQTFTKEQKDAIGAIVHDYILEHPEILPEAIQILQARDEAARLVAMKEAVVANRERLIHDGVSATLGNPKGDVTLVEFYDYQCPFCRRGHADVLRLIDSDPNIRVVYKQLPIKDEPGEEPGSLIAARMAMAAHQQGKFRAFHEAAMATPMPLTEAKLRAVATDVGLDMGLLWATMSSDSISKSIRDNMMLARSIGVNATPTYVIGDEIVLGAHGYEALKAAVEAERAGNKGGK